MLELPNRAHARRWRVSRIGKALTQIEARVSIWNDRLTSIPAVRLFGTNVARRIERTRSELAPGTVSYGATVGFSHLPQCDPYPPFTGANLGRQLRIDPGRPIETLPGHFCERPMKHDFSLPVAA
jgi:hypothetical protein